MKPLSATLLAIGLVVAVSTASAQSSGSYGNDPYRDNYYAKLQTSSNQASSNQVHPDGFGNGSGAIYDYARVVRVDPVIGSSYGYGSTTSSNPRCYDTTDRGGYANDPYRDDPYRDGYGNDPYRGDSYGNEPYDPQQSGYGTNTGRTVATVIGGIAGAVLGSKVGGGTGTYAATAIGSMIGGMAGRQVYENVQRNRTQRGTVRVCDPVPVQDGYSTSRTVNDGGVSGYDVTYEYAGRQFTTRTNYHPGDRIRVRVDVRPE